MYYEFISLGKSELKREYFKPPRNIGFVKPGGGLWACRYTPGEDYLCDWHYWCESEGFSGKCDKGVLFNIKFNSRIYVINSYRDLENLMGKYEYMGNRDYKFFSCLDFELLSKDFDAIELTSLGQVETRFSEPYNLYGWDVASILILNFDIIFEQQSLS